MVLYNSVVIFFEAFLTCVENIVLHYLQGNNDNFKKYVYGFC